MTNFGKHRGAVSTAAERYGKHSQANADVPVVEVLQRFAAQGAASRLAWRDDGNRLVEDHQEFPTAVLPIVRPTARQSRNADGDTESSGPAAAGDQWPWPGGFSWWPKALAG